MLSSSDSPVIRTVLGDISPTSLGHAQCHEHIFLPRGQSCQVNPDLCMDDMDCSLTELRHYAKAGGKLIVDAQPLFAGRDGGALAELSKRSGVKIVAVTGFHKKLFWDDYKAVASLPEDKLYEMFVSEVTVGMLTAGSRIPAQAGLVKLALERDGLSDPVYAKFISAAVAAAKATGAPVLVHTEPKADVLALLNRLEIAGVSPKRVIICHLDRTRHDESYHREVLSTGCFLCYDSINRLKYVSEEQELVLTEQMKNAGFLSQLLLSLDTTSRRLRAYGGYMGLDYILTQWLSKLKMRGFTEFELWRVCEENPARALTMKK